VILGTVGENRGVGGRQVEVEVGGDPVDFLGPAVAGAVVGYVAFRPVPATAVKQPRASY
jgi:hypothetical protein